MPKKPKPPKDEFLPLVPDRFYRWNEVVANRYFGYSNSQLGLKVKSGQIDPPVKLTAKGRASGWFGRDIIRLQNELQDAAVRRKQVA